MHQLVWNGWHEAVKGPNLANAPFSCGRCGHQSNGDGGEGTMMQAAGQWCPGVLWKLTGIWKSHLSLKRNHSGMRNPNSHSKGNGWDPILRKQLTVNVWGSIEGVCTDYKQMWKIKHTKDGPPHAPHKWNNKWWQHRLAFTWAKYNQLIHSSWRNGLRARPKSNARNGGVLHLLTKALPKQLQVEDSPARMGKKPKGTAGIAHYRPTHRPASPEPFQTLCKCMQMCHASTRSTCSAHSMLVVCVHNGLSEFMTSKHHLNMSMSMCIISLHQPELELIQLTNGCCWGAITSCTKPECSCWCGWWEMAGVFLTFFAHAAKTGFQHLCKLSAQKHFMFQAIKLFSFPLRISASLKSIGFSTQPLPRAKNCSFNKNHSQCMPNSCGFSMVAEVPLFLSNVNSKYRIVPSFAVACAEPSWSNVGMSIWLKTWSGIKVAKGKLQHVALWLG